MKSLRILTLIAVALIVVPAVSAADFGVRAGRYNDGDGEFVGAEVAFDVGAITINPNLEYSLEDDITAGTANVDITYDLLNIGSFTPYIGAGVGMSYVDDDFVTQTDVVGNLIGGVAFKLDFLEPYAQVKYFKVLDDNADDGADDDIALTIGLRF